MASKEQEVLGNMDVLIRREKLVQLLSRAETEFNQHLIKDHRGYIASTCHLCMNFETTIRATRYYLEHHFNK